MNEVADTLGVNEVADTLGLKLKLAAPGLKGAELWLGTAYGLAGAGGAAPLAAGA